MDFTCENCGAATVGVVCRDCDRDGYERLLTKPWWAHNAKKRTGDLEGETLFDTFFRFYVGCGGTLSLEQIADMTPAYQPPVNA